MTCAVIVVGGFICSSLNNHIYCVLQALFQDEMEKHLIFHIDYPIEVSHLSIFFRNGLISNETSFLNSDLDEGNRLGKRFLSNKTEFMNMTC